MSLSVLRSITEVDIRYIIVLLYLHYQSHFMGWEAMRWPFIRHGDGIWPRLFNLRFIDDFPVIWVDFLTWPGPINYLWSDRSHMSGKLVRSPSLHISQDDVNPWYRRTLGHFVLRRGIRLLEFWCHLKISNEENTCHLSTKHENWSDYNLNYESLSLWTSWIDIKVFRHIHNVIMIMSESH